MPDRPTRPLITGGAGEMGRALERVLPARFPETIAATRLELDVTEADRVGLELERLRPYRDRELRRDDRRGRL